MNRRGFLGHSLAAALAFLGVKTASTNAQDRPQTTISLPSAFLSDIPLPGLYGRYYCTYNGAAGISKSSVYVSCRKGAKLTWKDIEAVHKWADNWSGCYLRSYWRIIAKRTVVYSDNTCISYEIEYQRI